MAKPRIQDVMETLQGAILDAVATAPGVTVPGQVVVGTPVGPELIKILAQANAQGLITIYPRPGSARNVSRYPVGSGAEPIIIANPNVPLVATVTPNPGSFTLAFSGSVVAGLNVHALVGAPVQDAYRATSSGDTLATVASGTAAVILALGIPGVTAVALGPSVTVGGSPGLVCNIGGTAVVATASARHSRVILATLWTTDSAAKPPATTAQRWEIADAIINEVGTELARFLLLSDGTPMNVSYETDYPDDSTQSSYSAYAYHIAFACEYDILQVAAATQVEVAEATIAVDGSSPVTVITGG